MNITVFKIVLLTFTVSFTASALAAKMPKLSPEGAQTYCEIQFTAMKKSWDPATDIVSLVDEAVQAQKQRGVPFKKVGTTETEYRENLRTALISMQQHHSAFGNNRETFVTSMEQQEKACVQQLLQPGRE